ncbi:hypothetical protein [Kosakonia quasisacchari]
MTVQPGHRELRHRSRRASRMTLQGFDTAPPVPETAPWMANK